MSAVGFSLIAHSCCKPTICEARGAEQDEPACPQSGHRYRPHPHLPALFAKRSNSQHSSKSRWLSQKNVRYKTNYSSSSLGWESDCIPYLLSLVLHFYLQILFGLFCFVCVVFFNLFLEFWWKCQCLRNDCATLRQQMTINLTLPDQIHACQMFV